MKLVIESNGSGRSRCRPPDPGTDALTVTGLPARSWPVTMSSAWRRYRNVGAEQVYVSQ